jgi:hypothetical protein
MQYSLNTLLKQKAQDLRPLWLDVKHYATLSTAPRVRTATCSEISTPLNILSVSFTPCLSA